jgi:two-component system, cell cycle response regulator
LGHDAGDTLLSMVAARLVAAVRQEDTVARLGGDEYLIALWEYSHDDDLAKLASKVLQAVSKPYDFEGRSVAITASVGIGIFPIHGEEAETLIKSADLALYEAKRAGKNDYRIAVRTDSAAVGALT